MQEPQKKDAETWRECCVRIARADGVLWECLERLDQYIGDGVQKTEEACYITLVEWNCVKTPPAQETRPEYDDGTHTSVRVGDLVTLSGCPGCVVGIIQSREGLPGYDMEDWAYLKTGVLIEFEALGLIHFPDGPDEDTWFVSRKPRTADE